MNEPLTVAGEIDIETPPPVVPIVEPVVETPVIEPPEGETQTETPVAETQTETVVEGQQPEKPKKPGLVAELVEERKERKRLADEVASLRAEMQTWRAPQGPSDAEKAREQASLEATAQRLRLYTAPDAEGKQYLDLDAAKRVREEMVEVSRSVAAEMVGPVRRTALEKDAMHHIESAIAHATKLGMNEEAVAFIRDQYLEVAKQPNGAELLANPDVAKTTWRLGLGAALEAGVLQPTAAKKAPPVAGPPAIPAPAAGRRSGQQAAIQLSAKAQQVYRDAGMDPNKATSYKQSDRDGSIDLEG